MKKLNLSWLWTFLFVFVTAGISEVRAQNPTTVAGLFFRTLTNGNLAADKDGNPLDMSTGATTHLAPLAPASGTGSNATNIAWPTGFTYTFPTGTANSQVLSWSVASNGLIGLSATATSEITTGNNIAGGTGIRMGAFVTGLTNGGVSDSGVVRSKVFGTAPNQVLVVEFLNMKFTSSSPNAAGDVTHQVRFYENGGMFEFVYGEMALGAGSSTSVRAGVSTGSTAATNFNVDFNAHDGIYGSVTNTFNTVGPLAPFAGTTATTRRVYQFSPTAFPQQFVSASFLQASGSLPSGSTNQVVARLDVAATGTASPLDMTAIAVGTAGTNAGAISNLKVFYTGNSSTFADTAQFGSTAASPGSLSTITGSRTLLSGTNYFWITYDIPSTATVGDTVRATVGDFILAGVTRTPAAPATPAFRIVRTALTGTITVGTGGQYPNLGAAFSDIGLLGLSGNVNLDIISNITEPAAAVLGQWSEIGAGGYTLTIRPTGANRVISGNIPSSGVIVLVGADRVTIDGRVGGTGTGRDLTIRNDDNTAINTAILIAGQTTAGGGSDDVTIRNTVLMAGPTVGTTTATAAIQVQGTGDPSNNLVITNNEIKRSYRGIFVGTNAPTSSYLGLQITNNIIGSNDPQEYNTLRGIQVNRSSGAVISGNTIFNQLTTLSISIAGIEMLTGSDSAIISANRIYTIQNPTTSGYGAYGINLAAGSNHLVVNNDISDIATTNYSATSNTFNAFGIRITTGTGHRIHHNTVNMSGAYTSSNTTAGAAAVCITAAAVTAEMINNNFSNTITSTATGNKNIFAIWLPTATYSFANLSGTNYNNYFLGSEPYHIFAQRGTTFGANTIANIGAWQTAASVDANSIAVNPLFLATDLGLPNAPAMKGLGTPLASVTTDLNGATRSTTAPDMGAYEYTPINTDMAAVSLERVSSGCFGATESIKAIVQNTGLNAIQFGTDTLRLTLNVTGAATATVNLTVASGTLAAGDTLHVNVGPFNLSSFGNYSIAGSINQQNDGFAQNNNFAAVSFSNVAPLAVPFAYDFEPTSNTATLADLQAAGWSVASPWTIGAGGHGNPGNGLYANIYNSANNSAPSFTLPLAGPVLANSSFAFNYRLMNWSGYSTTPTTYAPSAADSIWFEISTDCGVTYTRLYTIDSASHIVDSNWASINIPLAQYAGQNVTIRLRSQWATGDYFLDMDNIGITAPLSAFSLVAPPNNTRLVAAGAGSATVNVSWTSAIQGPATYTWLVDAPAGNFSNPLVALPANNNGLDTNLTLTISQIHNLLGTLGVAIGDSADIIWTVRAQLGTQTLQATQTWAAKLVRGTLAPLRLAAAPVFTNANTGTRGPTGASNQAFLRVATIVTKAEMAAAAIDSGTSLANVALRATTGAAAAVRGKMTMYLRNASDTVSVYSRGAAWTGAIQGLSIVHDDSLTVRTTPGLMTIPFTQPFVYTGGAIEIAFEWAASAPFAATGAGYAANTAIVGSSGAAQSATAFPANLTITTNNQFRPELTWGADDRKANEVEVVTLFAKGRNPRTYGTPEVIQAIVRNNGYANRANLPVTLNIAGANTFTNVQTVANLAPDSTQLVTFSAFTGTALGFNNVTVSVPADENNANNTRTWAQEQTDSIYSYNDSVTVGNGAVGYNTGSGLLLSRFSITGTRSVAAARVRIGDGAAIAGNSVYAVVLNDSGVIVAQSAPVAITAAELRTWVVFPFSAPVNITNGNFFIGLAQPANSATGYFPVAFQGETPTRANAYFTAPLAGGVVPSPVANFRLMIEAHVGPQFTPADTMSRFNLVAPANNTTLNIQGDPTQTAQIRWRTSTRTGGVGTTTYEWLLDVPAGDFSNPVLRVNAGADTSLTLTYGQIVDSLAAKGVPVGGSFAGRWTVRAINGPVNRLANIPFTITLNRGVMTSIEETDFSKAISLYPNPAAYTAKLQVNVPGEKVLSVVIVNAVGQEMKKFHVSSSVANDMELDLTNLNEGLYFVRISDGNEMAIKRLMIQR